MIRLNSKIKARDVAVNDLVKDLSDGVCPPPPPPPPPPPGRLLVVEVGSMLADDRADAGSSYSSAGDTGQ